MIKTDTKMERNAHRFSGADTINWKGESTDKLNFEVEERPITVGDYVLPDKKALFRTDTNTYMATVSSSYPVIKHSDIIERIESNIMNNFGDAKIQTILSKEGNVMNRMYTFPEINVEVKKGDIIAPVIRVTNSFDGSTAVGFYIDAVRLVCTNGMVATRQFMSMQYKHFGSKFNINTFADNAHKMLKGFDDYAENWREWTNSEVSEERAKLLMNYLPKKLQVFAESRFDENFEGTKWGVYNTFTALLTHDYVASKGTDADSQKLKLGADFTKMMNNKFYWESDENVILNDLQKKNKIVTLDITDEDVYEAVNSGDYVTIS